MVGKVVIIRKDFIGDRQFYHITIMTHDRLTSFGIIVGTEKLGKLRFATSAAVRKQSLKNCSGNLFKTKGFSTKLLWQIVRYHLTTNKNSQTNPLL